jgi:hypothetical protein
MKGKNEMNLNQATLIDAMQHYLEKIMKDPVPKVTKVIAKGYDNDTEVTITTEGPDDAGISTVHPD